MTVHTLNDPGSKQPNDFLIPSSPSAPSSTLPSPPPSPVNAIRRLSARFNPYVQPTSNSVAKAATPQLNSKVTANIRIGKTLSRFKKDKGNRGVAKPPITTPAPKQVPLPPNAWAPMCKKPPQGGETQSQLDASHSGVDSGRHLSSPCDIDGASHAFESIGTPDLSNSTEMRSDTPRTTTLMHQADRQVVPRRFFDDESDSELASAEDNGGSSLGSYTAMHIERPEELQGVSIAEDDVLKDIGE
ncbi:hypothetical protein FRB95_010683 [Tulasnella sp. JGI-2019a]|nr:hypothetical protein FRB95_010683 [Tulasnella sp. JGI-2019a]